MWVIVRTAVALVVVAGAFLATVPGESQQPAMPEAAPLRVGDAGTYEMTLTGGWIYDGTQAAKAVPGPRFEVREPDLVTRADGSRVHAFPVLTEAPSTTLLPPEAGAATWGTWTGTQWLDKTRVATQSRGESSSALALGSTSSHDAVWDYHRVAADCLLTPPGAGGCDLPYLRLRLEAALLEDLGWEKVGVALLHHLRADDGTTRVDWWLAPGISMPVRMEASTSGAPGLPERTVQFRLTGFLPGDGPAAVLESSFAASPMEWLPRQPWGPDDAGVATPFPLSAAFQAARDDPSFIELRQWLRGHDGYAFMVEPSKDGDAWTIHLSDGRDGFSFIARQVDSMLPWEKPRVEVRRTEPSSMAVAAPALADAPATMPSVASMAQRWQDHARDDLRQRGVNAWAFRILEGSDGVVLHYAVGRAEELRWGVADLDVLGVRLGGAEREAAVLIADGQGEAVSFRQTDRTGQAFPASSPPFVPASMPYIAPEWPWSPAATGAGVAAAATLAWLAPKMALALFTRFRPGELLEHPMRATILDAVRAEPGIHFRALCTRLGANPGCVRHHVRKLIEGDHLVERASPGYTCYFPQGGTSRSLIQAGPMMRSEGARNLIGCLAQRPGANAKELAGLAGLSPATATYHLKRLQDVGLVDVQRDGRCLRLHLTPDGQQAWAAMG